jgi:hypothetical protein
MRDNKDSNPIFYANSDEMNKPLSVLMEELRSDVANVRGKLSDIRRSFGWQHRIDFIEGGISCLLIAMYSTTKEFKEFEDRKEKESLNK